MKSRTISAWITGVLLAALPALGFAQYPNKPIRVVVPYPPGGTSDVQLRAMQEPLQKLLGQPLIIENRPGAAGALGTAMVAKSPPDGYTLLLPNNALVITPHLNKDAGFALKDFAPVTLVSSSPMVMVVHPSVSATSVAQLVELAKKNPGQLEYATAGLGSFGHLATELFSRAAGIRMLHVPYKGQAPTTIAVLAGEAKVLMTTTSSQMNGYIKENRLRLIGVSSLQPSSLMPGAPLIAEAVPGFSAEVWFGLVAPAGTPREVLARIQFAVAQVLAMPDIAEKFAASGLAATSSTSEQFAARLNSEHGNWEKVIREANIKIE